MSRNWGWWEKLRGLESKRDEQDGRASQTMSREEIEARLIDAGVAGEWATKFASRIEPEMDDPALDPAMALVRGTALAFEMQAAMLADVEKNMRDVKEVERLLGAFSGELEKLDEVLEVLSAYAQRMRAKPGKATRRVLH